MKKTYINPALKVVKIQAARIMAGSPNPAFDPSRSTIVMEGRGAEFSDWDEEEE